jgi:hypothetical protein
MKKFLFFTKEGITLDPNHREIHNMQVLGDGRGNNIQDAFENFKCNQTYLSAFGFREVIGIEYIGNFIYNFEL